MAMFYAGDFSLFCFVLVVVQTSIEEMYNKEISSVIFSEDFLT